MKQEIWCAPFDGQREIRMAEEAGMRLRELLITLPEMKAITGVSGYRTKGEQGQIFEDALKEHGRSFTETYVAFPGCSEHQTGYAIDMAKRTEEIDFICPEFPDEGVCGIFREKAADYGFIERYPEDKKGITGIGAEPWHFRYVGLPHSRIIKEQGMVLEEYVEWIKQFSKENPYVWQEHKVYYIKGQEETSMEIPDGERYHISGNNVDGFVIALIGENDEKGKFQN